jgi:hypothetical protein
MREEPKNRTIKEFAYLHKELEVCTGFGSVLIVVSRWLMDMHIITITIAQLILGLKIELHYLQLK